MKASEKLLITATFLALVCLAVIMIWGGKNGYTQGLFIARLLTELALTVTCMGMAAVRRNSGTGSVPYVILSYLWLLTVVLTAINIIKP